ncbi:hypothetical protein BH23ACT5_BH23ACT5_05500 [soil metagenome]
MEFVLVLPLVVLVLVACLEVAALGRMRVELVAAAREGARAAATEPDPARAVGAVRETLGESASEGVRISVSRPHVVGRLATVELVLRQPLRAPLLDRLTVTLTARASMRVER